MTTSAHLPPKPFAYFGQLTGLRFLAALGVVFCHFEKAIAPIGDYHFWYVLGGNGVALFFVLSGFVIAGSLANQHQSYMQYALHRFARIVPVYWLSLLVTLFLFMLGGWHYSAAGMNPTKAQLISSFFINVFAIQAWFPSTLIQQFWNAPAWSISSELFFYLCAPFILIRLAATKFLFVYLWVLTALLISGYYLIAPNFLGNTSPWLDAYPIRLPLFGLMPFLFGMALYQHYASKPTAQKNRTPAICLTCALIVAVNWWIAKEQGTEGWNCSAIYLFYLLAVPGYALLIYLLIHDQGIISKILSLQSIILLGNASYSLYLFHWIALLAILRHVELPLGIGYTSLYVLALIIFSVGVYCFFEKPIKDWITSYLIKQ
jgi:peptidoglycan/LPS O-acetylase OafA/YrhL